MILKLIFIVLLTFVPGLELRFSIPYGIVVLGTEYWPLVFLVGVVANIVLGIVLYAFFHHLITLIQKIDFVHKIYKKHLAKAERKIQKGVVKYGIISLGLFIAIPLPGTGSYSGALVANLLGMRRRDFFWANAMGVTIAGIVVTLIMLSGNQAFDFFVLR
ncbi:MAG: small multi-drug export protein [Nanoarchaeota archaeon]|nr:small multi-drug export protein [Nanoarchaeota archaeon]